MLLAGYRGPYVPRVVPLIAAPKDPVFVRDNRGRPRRPPVTSTCERPGCGVAFTHKACDKRQFCSRLCWDAVRGVLGHRPCERTACGRKFKPRRASARWCSPACAAADRKPQGFCAKGWRKRRVTEKAAAKEGRPGT